MITTCIRKFGSLPVIQHTTGKEYWHHGQQSLGCKHIDFRWNLIIANSLIICQSFHNLSQLTKINNIIMAWTVLNAFMTWSRFSVKPTEFAIALKWSFHRFAILLFPEVTTFRQRFNSDVILEAAIGVHMYSWMGKLQYVNKGVVKLSLIGSSRWVIGPLADLSGFLRIFEIGSRQRKYRLINAHEVRKYFGS